MEQIDKDVRRTLSEFAFFQNWVPLTIECPVSPCNTCSRNMYFTARSLFLLLKNSQSDFGSRKHEGFDQGDQQDGQGPPIFEYGVDYHWEVVERILFVYASLNPGVGYVQGMNELLGPLYFLMANDPDEENKAHAEADSFWLFSQLMSELRDYYLSSMDNDAHMGITASFQKLSHLLQLRDADLFANLVC